MLDRVKDLTVETEEDLPAALIKLGKHYGASVTLGSGDSSVTHRPHETLDDQVAGSMTDYPLGRSTDMFPIRIEFEGKSGEHVQARCEQLVSDLRTYLLDIGFKVDDQVPGKTTSRIAPGVFRTAACYPNLNNPHRAEVSLNDVLMVRTVEL